MSNTNKLDGKFAYIERAMEKAGVKIFQRLTNEQYNIVGLIEKNQVIVEPVEVSKYQKMGDFLVELPTVPKMVGKVVKSTIDNIVEGDYILYANNYVRFKYILNVEDLTKLKLIIKDDDVIMKKKYVAL